ncbi:MAG: Rrf2 family transcriptional regulator [Ideonella sp.]|jgi:Rrf2 family transcriptional regulator, nitric oxide-sensitive transcriptional repressor|nr:Rrf2 family transcriptional regulator [Ideonella sp.]MBL0151880.1 Rrf2 family transcriptional regulator [Ideonella sp.]
MKLTSFTDYSLRVLIYLAARPEQRATVAEIAQAYGIKQNHLTKVVHFLGRQGWLTTVRGKGGGLQLAVPAADVGIDAVVRAAEGADLPAECFAPDANTCPIARVCRLKRVLREATEAFHAVLNQYTLADLVRQPRALSDILHLARHAA